MTDGSEKDPPFEGGSQPVKERRAEVPTGGRSVVQTAVIGVAILIVIAALLWAIVPFGG